MNLPLIKNYPWGQENIVWGFELDHAYTLKVLSPKVGRSGCLSLQCHDIKSETWIVYSGLVWLLVQIDNKICTRNAGAGVIQRLKPGQLHRMMGLTEDCQIIEASSLDANAADASVTKDVLRFHCVHGRDVILGRTELERELVSEAARITEAALKSLESGELPKEHNIELLDAPGNYLSS